jgi:radical SAM protein with 4Fe4S-binding SPASM domain
LKELGEKKMTPTVFFHLLGDPLVNKDVFDAIRLANSYGLSVSLYTNGALLDYQRSSKLLEVLRKGRVVLSLQEISPEKFDQRSHGNLSWQEYIERLLAFVHMANAREDPLSVQVHCMIDMQGRAYNFSQLFSEQKRIQAVYDQWRCDLGLESKRRRINVLDPTRSYPLGKNSSFFVKHQMTWSNQLIDQTLYEVIPKETGNCALMTDTFGILANGTCVFCCNDYEGELNLGNAHESSLEEIYYAQKATMIRRAEEQGQFIEDVCQKCQGTLVDKTTKKPVQARIVPSDYYVLKEHLNRYGLKSAMRKIAGRLYQRLPRKDPRSREHNNQ